MGQKKLPRSAGKLLCIAAGFTLLLCFSFLIENPIWFYSTSLYCSFVSVGLTCMSCWIIYSARVYKPQLLSDLVDNLALSGDEIVLDLGCGGGDFLIETAKQLPSGRACGLDLWSEEGEMESVISEAKEAGVAKRIELKRGDMRHLPYPDSSFDLITSSFALHALEHRRDRKRALAEMRRVLKPGGKAIIIDTHHGKHTQRHLSGSGRTTLYTYCPPVEIVEYTHPKAQEES